MAAAEQDILDGLTAAGFKLDFGIDGAGISRFYFTRGGGYYIDVGCSKLIIEGKIRVKHSPEGIARFYQGGLELKDGSLLQADVVVLATGYDNMRTTVRKTLGDQVADRCNDVWDLDEEGELKAVCRMSSIPWRHSLLTHWMLLRSGVRQAAIPASGSWAATWRCAGCIPSSWHCRLRLMRQASSPGWQTGRSCRHSSIRVRT